jgi:hypothetical protein
MLDNCVKKKASAKDGRAVSRYETGANDILQSVTDDDSDSKPHNQTQSAERGGVAKGSSVFRLKRTGHETALVLSRPEIASG